MKDRNYKIDIVPGIVLALFSIFYMFQIQDIRVFKGLGSTPLNNRFVPWLWGSTLLLLSLWITVRGFLKFCRFKARNEKSESSSLLTQLMEKREVIASFIALVLYVAFLGSVGFVIDTIVYVFVQILILTPLERWRRNVLPAAVTAVVSSCLLFYIFRVSLNVLLPVGSFGFGV